MDDRIAIEKYKRDRVTARVVEADAELVRALLNTARKLDTARERILARRHTYWSEAHLDDLDGLEEAMAAATDAAKAAQDATQDAPIVPPPWFFEEVRLPGDQSDEEPLTPPKSGLFVLALVAPKEVFDAVEGDLAEDFARYAEERGRAFAVFWYWRQIAVSALPFLWRTIEGAARLAEVWKKISGG